MSISSSETDATARGLRRISRSVEAYNTSVTTENKIHDDEVASKFGFKGALVAGVNVYAYMTSLAVTEWGQAWLERGAMDVEFLKPVYDGERLEVEGLVAPDGEAIKIEVTGTDSVIRARGTARREGEPSQAPVPELRPLPAPEDRPLASSDLLKPGTVLGSLRRTYRSADAAEYLRAVREDLPIYGQGPYVHPGWLLRWANYALCDNVELGPWIHVSSHIIKSAAVLPDQELDVRARVLEEYEHREHKYVVLDVVLQHGGRTVERIKHTAIYRPRQRAD